MSTFSTSNITTREVGTNGGPVVYDDLQASLGRVRLGSSAPTWRNVTHGVGGGINFDVLGFAVNNFIYFDIQSTHSMQLNSILDCHIHWSTDGTAYSAATDDRIKFQLDVIAASIGGDWAVPTGSPFTKELQMTTEDASSHGYLELADIPAVNSTVSTIYKCKLTRIAASADDYTGEILIHFVDCHYKKDTVGSLQEDSKV